MSNFPALRPKSKTTGPTINLRANILAFKGSLKIEAHSYLVTFQPEIKKDLIHPYFTKVLEVHAEHFKDIKIAFDGLGMLVTNKKISDKELEFSLGEGDRQKNFQVSINFKNSVDLEDINKVVVNGENLDIAMHIQIFETIIRHYQLCNFYAEGRRTFNNAERRCLTGGIEVWGGVSQCLRVTNKGLFLNVDISFMVFYEEVMILDLIAKLGENTRGGGRPGSSLGEEFYRNLSNFLKGARMTTIHRKNNPKFRISGIKNVPANEIYFEGNNENNDTKKISVAEYFARTYSPLKHPHLPVAVLKRGNVELYFPLEVLKILPNQKFKKKLDERQTADMIRFAAKPPIERFEFLRKRIADLNLSDNQGLKNFNVLFDTNFSSCKGRLLKAPTISYGKSSVNPERGSWNLRGVTALKPVNIKKWMVLSMDKVDVRMVRHNISALIQSGEKFGMVFSPNYLIKEIDSPSKYFEILEKEVPELAIVILKTKSSTIYNEIKKIAETRGHGIVTQCILFSNFRNLVKPPFAGNILIKINAKLGGKNSKLQLDSPLLRKPTIVFGADLSHPGIGSLSTKSVAAIVASMDKDLGRYSTSIKAQDKGQEIIENLDVEVKEMLVKFRNINKVDPQKIIFFRDGVGESQFYSVFKSEIEAIKKACSAIKEDYNPELTFIVAQKRHSMKFMADGGNGNVVPGTIVDEIGHPVYFDFYLVSHYALQGTARPVRYQILVNDSNHSAEELQEFIHNFSYLYARATKAVSVVPPIYYAHLAAARATAYMDINPSTNMTEMKEPVKHLVDKLYYI